MIPGGGQTEHDLKLGETSPCHAAGIAAHRGNCENNAGRVANGASKDENLT